ncbi:porin [Thioalkalivibrio sulfidiphilus]|uniref:Putative porin n=1 Tax=Thioalkalivibrio sulfidiphilus (strain HL-EbGR7) TaxID=396588 RepID=B8GNG7_THISH|nr:porin [Thioalkalivibrio sulfidiphilus]ACL73858.1 putative porin [Thioalkalivibrio sulfidiphilus HL-EbGr7]
MKKQVLVVAVAAALAVPAVAMADASIYGRAHVSFDYLDNDGDYSATNVSNNSSRVGVRGSQQLTDDLKGFFQVESNFEAAGDSNNGRLGTRNTFVGLEGGFGRIRAGYSDTVTKGISRATDLFGDQAGDSRNMLNGIGDQRFRNALFYTSPKLGPVTVSVEYSTNDNTNSTAADSNDDQAYSLGAVYREGPLYIGLGYEARDFANGTDNKATRLGAYYDMDAFRFTGLYQAATDAADNDLNTFGLGVRYTMGKTQLKAQYYWTDNDGTDADAAMLALGVQYNLTRQTSFYAAYAMTDNDDTATYRPAGGGHGDNIPGVVGGSSPSIISFGVMHNFKFDF